MLRRHWATFFLWVLRRNLDRCSALSESNVISKLTVRSTPDPQTVCHLPFTEMPETPDTRRAREGSGNHKFARRRFPRHRKYGIENAPNRHRFPLTGHRFPRRTKPKMQCSKTRYRRFRQCYGEYFIVSKESHFVIRSNLLKHRHFAFFCFVASRKY